jgi:hypothetical protein
MKKCEYCGNNKKHNSGCEMIMSGDLNIKIIKTKPSIVIPQSQWNLIERDGQWIIEPKTEEEMLEYKNENTTNK